MSKTKLLYQGLFLATCMLHMHAMVFDNRFLPLLQQPHLSIDGTRSQFSMELMLATANQAFNEHQNDVPLPEIYGVFDQADLAKSIVALGKPNPLPSEFQGTLTRIPWIISGKRQMQGVRFYWHQSIVSWLSTGFSWLFMRVNSRDEFTLNEDKIEGKITVKPGDAILLQDSLKSMFSEVGIVAGDVNQAGFGDIDWYVRAGNMWEYTARFRRIDAGVRFGALFATGQRQEINRPQSIPFGGDGNYGFYTALDGMFEVRENWKTGFLLRFNKRFANTKVRRMSGIGKEPLTYGAVVGNAQVNPGVTVIFDPYVLMEGVRDGLALGLNYTLIWHQPDSWCSRACAKVVDLKDIERTSEWASEYFTVNVLYDFGKVRVKREFNPVVTFRWDIPSSLFISSRSSRTNCVSLGVEFVY